jgi:TusA-related sulfurtransferase
MMVIEVPVTRTIDARGSYSPGPLMEVIRALRAGAVGECIAIWSTDAGTRIEIPAWVADEGHRLVGIESRDGYDEIIIEKRW